MARVPPIRQNSKISARIRGSNRGGCKVFVLVNGRKGFLESRASEVLE